MVDGNNSIFIITFMMIKKQKLFITLLPLTLICFCWIAQAGARSDKTKLPGKNIIPAKMVAIFPFRNFTARPADNWLMDGFREGITSILIEGDENKIVGRETLDSAISQANLSAQEYFNTDKVAAVGRSAGANTAVMGSFQNVEGALTVFLRIVDCSSAQINNKFRIQIGSPKNYRFFYDIYDLTVEVQEGLGWRFDKVSTTKAQKILTRTKDIKAYEFLINGKRALMAGPGQDSQVSVVWFQEALKRDYNYSLAHAGLASAYAIQAFYLKQQGQEYQFTMGRARSSLQQALALEPDLPKYHYRVAKTYIDSDVQYLLGLTFMGKGECGKAIKAFEKGLSLTPNDIMAKKYLNECKGKTGN